MNEPSPERLQELERQAREAFRPKPKATWKTVLVVASLIGGAYSLIWGNAIFGGVLVVCGTFLNWLFSRVD